MLQSAPQLVSNDVFLQFEAEHIGYDEFSELFHSCLLSLRAHSNLTQLLCTMPKHDFPSSPLPPPLACTDIAPAPAGPERDYIFYIGRNRAHAWATVLRQGTPPPATPPPASAAPTGQTNWNVGIKTCLGTERIA